MRSPRGHASSAAADACSSPQAMIEGAASMARQAMEDAAEPAAVEPAAAELAAVDCDVESNLAEAPAAALDPPIVATEIPLGTDLSVQESKVWYAARVVETRDGALKVHFMGWKIRYDEWISVDSPRLRLPKRLKKKPMALAALPGSIDPDQPAATTGVPPDALVHAASAGLGAAEQQRQEQQHAQHEEAVVSPLGGAAADAVLSSPVQAARGTRLRVEQFGVWYNAKVIEVDEEDAQLCIHYEGWKRRHDEWLPNNSARLKLFSPMRSPRGHASSAAAHVPCSLADNEAVPGPFLSSAHALPPPPLADGSRTQLPQTTSSLAVFDVSQLDAATPLPVGTQLRVQCRSELLEAHVVAVRAGDVRVRFSGRGAEEWIAVNSSRILMAGDKRMRKRPISTSTDTMAPTHANRVCESESGEQASASAALLAAVGMLVHVMQVGNLVRARVEEIRPETGYLRVHYCGRGRELDEWLPLTSARIKIPPCQRSPRLHASSAAVDAARAAACRGDDKDLEPSHGSSKRAKTGAGALACVDGWATAVAAETLAEFTERKIWAVDWFHAFSNHVVSKRSAEGPEQLLGRFVLAINELQLLGLAAATKRPRGTIEKRFFGGV